MRPEQWQIFKKAAKRQAVAAVPTALIVDSPWIPGYLGINHFDFFLDPEVWFQANARVLREFPDVIFFPSWWMEYGMAIEPSAMGARISFAADQTPSMRAMLFHLDDVDRLAPVDPYADGFMSLALQRYRMQKQRIFDAGYTIPVATARGPLCTAAFLHDLSRLMLNMAEDPAGVHRLLAYTTEATIQWLKAQADVIGPSVEGIFILDDIVGFISHEFYRKFAHPYLKQICDAFPSDWVKVYHNDASVKQCLEDLPDTGFDVLNFTHKLDIGEAHRRTGGRMCLMGNVAPLDLGVRGTPDQVKAAALEVLRKTEGRNLILSVGGGVSPGMPKANIEALVAAAREFNESLVEHR
ncbi:MAG: uroporphyrinogen decarboxylase family protein [Acidobacteriia bacterium]|nr:uroporphyrinogen decarboxylase family protein [Terriglobia bacterium]